MFVSNKSYEKANETYNNITIEIGNIFNANPDLSIGEIIIGIALFILSIALIFIFILYIVIMNLIQQFLDEASKMKKDQIQLSDKDKKIIEFVIKHPYILSLFVIILLLYII